jgi:hypothetical protein
MFPRNFVFSGGITLLGYVILKEVFRWYDLDEGITRHWGEFYVMLVIGSFLWMQG